MDIDLVFSACVNSVSEHYNNVSPSSLHKPLSSSLMAVMIISPIKFLIMQF